MLGWYALYCLIVIVPLWRLLPRHGIPAWASILAVVPALAVILLWVMAFSDKMGLGGGDDAA